MLTFTRNTTYSDSFVTQEFQCLNRLRLAFLMKTWTFRLLFIIGVIVLNALFAFAQTAARVSGTVKDLNGAVVLGAQITLRGTISRAVLTDEKGEFTLQNVPPGDYELRVSANGFA